MILPEAHVREQERISALESYSILDTIEEEDYDNLTAIAAEICGTPISLISLIDRQRQWFKSSYGLEARETSRDYSFCAHAIHHDDVFIVNDATKDKRFHDNPSVTGPPYVKFYAGVPLNSQNKLPIGTLCVVGNTPRYLDDNQLNALKALAKQVMNLLEFKRNKQQLNDVNQVLTEQNKELEKFAYIAAHDLKSPLYNIQQLVELSMVEFGDKLDEKGKELIHLIERSSTKLTTMIDGLLTYSKSAHISSDDKSKIDLSLQRETIAQLLTFDDHYKIKFNTKLAAITTNDAALKQILLNLISNSIKYNDKKQPEVVVEVTEDDKYYKFSVKDNGPGIAKKHQKDIFNLFEVLSGEDRFGYAGNGIGLATVKRTVHALGGSIRLKSAKGQGSEFRFTIKK